VFPIAGRTMDKRAGIAAEAIVADAKDSLQIGRRFDRAPNLEVVVFSASLNLRTPFRDIAVGTFKEAWRTKRGAASGWRAWWPPARPCF